MSTRRCFFFLRAALLPGIALLAQSIGAPLRALDERALPPPELAQFFEPPLEYQVDYGRYRSPLRFDDASIAHTLAGWKLRRADILALWQSALGRWPPLITNPRVEVVNSSRRERITQQQLRIEIGLANEMVDALLLIDETIGPRQRRPAALVVGY